MYLHYFLILAGVYVHHRRPYTNVNLKMKYCIIGTSIYILCFIILMTDMSYSRSTLSSMRIVSNLSHYSKKTSPIFLRRGRFRKNRIEYDKKALDHLKAIRADHNERKAAFFEKELETCFSQMEKYHQTTTTYLQRDHFKSIASTGRTTVGSYINTTRTAHGLSKVGKSTKAASILYVSTPPNSHKPSKVGTNTEAADLYTCTTTVSQGLSNDAEAENGNSRELKDHNFNLTQSTHLHRPNLNMFWNKELELSKLEKHFYAEELTGWDVSVWKEDVFFNFKVGAIEPLEEFYESYLPKLIMYEDVADEMKAWFSEDEIVHAHLLLCVMEKRNLIQRNGTSTEKIILPMPMDKLQKIITPRIARWMLFLLFSEHASLSTLRSKVKSEPRLTLYEFCWSISKTWDVGNGIESDNYDGKMACSWMMNKVEEYMGRWDESEQKYCGREAKKSLLGPFLRSMNFLLAECDVLGVQPRKTDGSW